MLINVILAESFKKWLQTLGYAEDTVYGSTQYVKDFFLWLETEQIIELNQVNSKVIINYHKHLQTRNNKIRPGGLSVNTITSNINALKRFSRYLQETGKPFFDVDIQTKPEKGNIKTILTQSEIKALYKACGNDYLGIRDRAILSVYYGCGLRRSEGLALNVSDILLKERRIYVRKGKNYRERYVPMTLAVKEDFENYIYIAREQIRQFKGTRPEAFLLSMQVKRICGNSVIERVHKLAHNINLQKEIGLHTLRHSIATHLLQSGLELEDVSRFLGHSSLENTQIYTHLANEQ